MDKQHKLLKESWLKIFNEFEKQQVARKIPVVKDDPKEFNKLFVDIVEKVVNVLKKDKRLDTENINLKKFEDSIKKIITSNFVRKILEKNPKVDKDNAIKFAKKYIEDNYYDYLRSQDATNILDLVAVEPPGLIENKLDF